MTDQPVPALDQLTADRQLLASPSRQAPAAVVFIGWRFVKGLGAFNLGIALLFVINGRLSGALLGIGTVLALVGLVFMILAWLRFVYSVEGDELLVTKGVVAEERLTIPLDRVQSVSINQKFLHRLIGLVSVSVDTAGSNEAEFEIDAVERPKAEALQRLVAGHRRATTVAGTGAGPAVGAGGVAAAEHAGGGVGFESPPQPADVDVVRRRLPDLIRIGISRWPWAGLVALGPLLALANDFGEALPIDLPEERLIQDRLPTEFGGDFVLIVVVAVLVGIVAISLFGALLQVASEVVSNWDMRLTRTPTGLRRTSGLFSKTSKASTLSRIQGVQTDQTPMQRMFGLRKLTLPTVGEGDIGVPGATEDELSTIRGIVFASSKPPPFDRKISPLSIFLAVRGRVFFALPLAAVLFFWLGWFGLLVLLSVPLEWVLARRRWRLRRWSISDGRIAESYELVNKHTAELDLIKAQTVSVRQSFFERRRGLATVQIRTADGYLAVPLIDLAEATAVRDLSLFVVESDRRSFM